MASINPTSTKPWHLYVPKLVTTLRRGHGVAELRHGALAGLTVAIVALPLAMALAIASGTTPDKGLHCDQCPLRRAHTGRGHAARAVPARVHAAARAADALRAAVALAQTA